MRWWNILRLRLRSLVARRRVEDELDEELRYHLARQIEADIASGMTPDQARRGMAGVEQRKEECRDARGVNLLDNLGQDLRFAARQLLKSPGFTAIAVLMIALGMAASVAIVGFVDAALVKPLPYREPDTARERDRKHEADPARQPLVSRLPRLEAAEHRAQLARRPQRPRLHAADGHGHGARDRRARERRVLSHARHQPRRSAAISTRAKTCLGHRRASSSAMPRGRSASAPASTSSVKRSTSAPFLTPSSASCPRTFQFAPRGAVEFWTTLRPAGGCDTRRSCHNLGGVGRLKDGVAIETARAEMESIARQLEAQYPDSNRDQGASVIDLSEVIVGDIRPILLVLLGGAGLLLLIACVNVASLVLVRSESRRRELAVRSALGASKARLVRQFVTESLVLVGLGSVAGVTISGWLMQVLLGLIPAPMLASMPFLSGAGLNVRVLACAGAIALAATVVCSLAPMLRLARSDVRAGMAEGERGSSGNTWQRLGFKLVVLELATAMVLLVGAGLLGKSLYRLLNVDLGFRPDRLATLQVAVPGTRYPAHEQIVALGKQIIERIAALPGVESVGLASLIPVSFNGNTDWIRFVGRPYNGEHNEVNQRDVSAGYLQTIGAALVRGRYFAESDDATKPRVVIVNQALARRYFPGEDPIGKRFGGITPRA